MSRLVLALRSTPQPVIAAVNGPAAGVGLALTLGSDIRYAARSAVFRAVFVNIGVSNCDMWGIRLTKAGMWSALEIPSAQAAVEYEDRQQIMALHGAAPQEAVSAFLEKRAASLAD